MAKFEVGDEVRVMKSASDSIPDIAAMIGNVYKVANAGKFGYEIGPSPKESLWFFREDELELANPHPEEIEHNGRTYILKPEPLHEWKFGDWARHEEYGVVFVLGNVNSFGKVQFYKLNSSIFDCGPDKLTYISSVEIPE